MTPATARITLLTFFAMVILLSLPACNDGCGFGSGSCIGIGEPQPEPEPTDELVCRTISVDQCFAVQCGYFFGTPDVFIEANELFCPEDFCAPPRIIVIPPRECEPEVIVEVIERIVVEEVEVEVHTWTCDDFEDGRPNGHKPKECRGHNHDDEDSDSDR